MAAKRQKQPKKISKVNVAVALLALAVCAVGIFKFYQQSRAGMKVDALAFERMKGDPAAKAKIAEFIDFQCPSCAEGARILRSFMKNYPDLLQVEMKYFPLQGHRHGMLSALYAECAARQEKFWPMHDKLIDFQDQWSRLADARPAFDLYAEEVGLEMSRLRSCLGSDEAAAYINGNKEEGLALGIRSTPSYVIDGKLVVGTKSLQEFLGKITAAPSSGPANGY